MASKLIRGRRTKILILNPNSSQSMTEGMKNVINDIDLPYSTEIYTYTGPPSAPASINDAEGIQQSTAAVLSGLPDDLHEYDGVVVACFSVHPLVQQLVQLPSAETDGSTTTTAVKAKRPAAVTGIFEASILTALSLLEPGQKWGIVTTGAFWEDHLSQGVRAFLGVDSSSSQNSKFAGVESTGLNASDFHDGGVGPGEVELRLKQATKRLLAGGRTLCVVMGCAGMAGLEAIIRAAAAEELGDDFAYGRLHVVDGVRAGVMLVEQMVRHQRLRRVVT